MATYKISGPVDIVFNSVALGVARDGVVIRFTRHHREILDDAHGDAPADLIFTGKSCVVEFTELDSDKFGDTDPFADEANNNPPGILVAGNYAYVLKLTERGGEVWSAPLAVRVGDTEFLMTSRQEDRVANQFRLLPNSSGQLFTTVPAYVK